MLEGDDESRHETLSQCFCYFKDLKWAYSNRSNRFNNKSFSITGGATKLMKFREITSLGMVVVVVAVWAAAVPIITTQQQQQAYAQITSTNTTTNATATTTTTNATNNATIGTMDPNVPASATAPPSTVGTTQIIMNLTWFEDLNPFDPTNPAAPPQYGESVEPLSAANIQYQQQDPAFLKLAQTTFDCVAHQNEITKKIVANPQFGEDPGSGLAYTAEDIQRQDLCTDVINQGVAQICEPEDFAALDIAKCEEARTMTDTYVGVTEMLYG